MADINGVRTDPNYVPTSIVDINTLTLRTNLINEAVQKQIDAINTELNTANLGTDFIMMWDGSKFINSTLEQIGENLSTMGTIESSNIAILEGILNTITNSELLYLINNYTSTLLSQINSSFTNISNLQTLVGTIQGSTTLTTIGQMLGDMSEQTQSLQSQISSIISGYSWLNQVFTNIATNFISFNNNWTLVFGGSNCAIELWGQPSPKIISGYNSTALTLDLQSLVLNANFSLCAGQYVMLQGSQCNYGNDIYLPISQNMVLCKSGSLQPQNAISPNYSSGYSIYLPTNFVNVFYYVVYYVSTLGNGLTWNKQNYWLNNLGTDSSSGADDILGRQISTLQSQMASTQSSQVSSGLQTQINSLVATQPSAGTQWHLPFYNSSGLLVDSQYLVYNNETSNTKNDFIVRCPNYSTSNKFFQLGADQLYNIAQFYTTLGGLEFWSNGWKAFSCDGNAGSPNTTFVGNLYGPSITVQNTNISNLQTFQSNVQSATLVTSSGALGASGTQINTLISQMASTQSSQVSSGLQTQLTSLSNTVQNLQSGILWASCQCCANTNQSLTGTSYNIDGQNLAIGNNVLLVGQTLQQQNGIYIFNGTSLQRTVNFTTINEIIMSEVVVLYGTQYYQTRWFNTNSTGDILGTTPITYQQMNFTYNVNSTLLLSGITLGVNPNLSLTSLDVPNITSNNQISTLQSQMTTANGNISTNTSNISTQGGQISTLQSQMTTANGNISTNTNNITILQGILNTVTNAELLYLINNYTSGLLTQINITTSQLNTTYQTINEIPFWNGTYMMSSGITHLSGNFFANGNFSSPSGTIYGTNIITDETNISTLQGYFTAGVANYANSVANITGGLANQIIYQTGANTTNFLSQPASTGQILTYNGTNIVWGSAVASNIIASLNTTHNYLSYIGFFDNTGSSTPIYANSGITYNAYSQTLQVNNLAVTGTFTGTVGLATTSTNIKNGANLQIPYQTGSSATSFIAAPTVTGSVLTYTGSTLAFQTAVPTIQYQQIQAGYQNMAAFTDSVWYIYTALTLTISVAGTYKVDLNVSAQLNSNPQSNNLYIVQSTPYLNGTKISDNYTSQCCGQYGVNQIVGTSSVNWVQTFAASDIITVYLQYVKTGSNSSYINGIQANKGSLVISRVQ